MKFGLSHSVPLLLVLLVVAAKGHTVLQCYVCDNCANIDKNTPLQQCGGEHFSMTTTTSASMPTSESTSTSTSTSTTTTTTEAPTTTPTSTTTTTTSTTTTTRQTEIQTPPTIGPIPSTTDLPTPPSLEEHMAGHENHDHMEAHMNHSLPANFTLNSTLTTPPSIFVTPSEEILSTTEPNAVFPLGNFTFNETIPSAILVRQRRHTEFNGITYHCYKIQKKYDNVFGTKRGCIGVKTEQSACAELNVANNNQTKKCAPCTTTKCNGSSTIGVSIATLLVALIAVIYKA